jgi:hypothetical protein
LAAWYASPFDELADQREHPGDRVGRARLVVGRDHAERGGVLVHRLDEPAGERIDRFAVRPRPAG